MEKKMVNLTIDNIPVTVPEGTTVLEAAYSAGIKIPSLCFLKDVTEIGACRICVVEVKGARSLMAALSLLAGLDSTNANTARTRSITAISDDNTMIHAFFFPFFFLVFSGFRFPGMYS